MASCRDRLRNSVADIDLTGDGGGDEDGAAFFQEYC